MYYNLFFGIQYFRSCTSVDTETHEQTQTQTRTDKHTQQFTYWPGYILIHKHPQSFTYTYFQSHFVSVSVAPQAIYFWCFPVSLSLLFVKKMRQQCFVILNVKLSVDSWLSLDTRVKPCVWTSSRTKFAWHSSKNEENTDENSCDALPLLRSKTAQSLVSSGDIFFLSFQFFFLLLSFFGDKPPTRSHWTPTDSITQDPSNSLGPYLCDRVSMWSHRTPATLSDHVCISMWSHRTPATLSNGICVIKSAGVIT